MQCGVGLRCTAELQLHLFVVVAVDVAVATGPDEIAHVQIALLRHHVGEQGVAGNIEWHTQKDVSAALVQLTAQTAFAARCFAGRHIELEKGMAGHERHLVELGHVPGAYDDAAAVGVGLEGMDDVSDLVDVVTARGRPAAPLHAVDRSEVAIGTGPFVPDGAAALLQPFHIAVAAQEPQQLHDDGLQEYLFGGDQGEAFVEVEAHLVAKHTAGAGAGAVAFVHTVGVDMAHEVFVLGADGVGHVRLLKMGAGSYTELAREPQFYARKALAAGHPRERHSMEFCHERTGLFHQPAIARAHCSLDAGGGG